MLGARVVVADLTGLNANVFYELGIRHAARKPVVLISETEPLPFDTGQLRTVMFHSDDLQSGDECRSEVARQIAAALEGRFYSPVTTALDLSAAATGTTTDRT